ncbi:hypothetical protein ACLB2K_048155 [Fragaria x ananassa]
MPTSLHVALNLSSNLFEGPIPNHLSMLTGLEILDLSNNKFSGQIPSVLADQLVALTQLILSNNQLSGVSPHFNTWVMVNTDGNARLIKGTTPSLVKKGNSKALPIALAAVDSEQEDSREDLPPLEVLQGSILTANAIHRSSIDFATAMEVVSDFSNIELNTRC